MPVRIYDIAKKLGIDSKQVLAKASELGIAARVASSSLDARTGEYLESNLRDELAATFRRGLRGLALGNFKAFREVQNVPIRPLTLIFGANSSGKSSVLHGLLLGRHAVDTGELDVTRTEIGGDSMDLGGFRQYVHRREAGRRVEWSAELDVGTLRGQGRQLLSKHKSVKVSVTFGVPLEDPEQHLFPGMADGRPQVNGRPWVISYEIEAESRVILRLSRRPDGTMHMDRLDMDYMEPLVAAVLQINTTAEATQRTVTEAMRKTLDELVPTLQFTARGLLPDRLLGDEDATAGYQQLLPIQRGDRLEQLVGAAKLFVPRAIADVVIGVNSALRGQLGRVCYLGPLRSFPPRHLAFRDDRGTNWLAGGGYAWDVVRTNGEVRDAVNRWLGSDVLKTRYQLQTRTLAAMDEMEQPIAEALEELPIEIVEEGRAPSGQLHDDGDLPVYGVENPQMEAKGVMELLRQRVSETFDELVLMDLRSNTAVTHRDVGIGISQVLPVLVHAYADRGQIVAIEQPEIHLHAELQAAMGDVFIKSALGENENTFLLETHSEHLILRIMRRMRETQAGTLPKGALPVTTKDVSVLFVEPDGARSIVREMPLNERGELVKAWPGGFFEESYRELFT